MVLGEKLILADFFHAGLDSAQGAGADDSHAIFLTLVQLFQNGHDTDARFCLCLQSLNDFPQFAANVLVDFGVGELEAMSLLQAGDDAAEVLTDEGGHEIGARVAISDVVLLEHLVGKFGTCFEGEFFGQNQSIVTIEEELGDLD